MKHILRPFLIMVLLFLTGCQFDDSPGNSQNAQGEAKFINLEDLEGKPKAFEKIKQLTENSILKSTSFNSVYGITINTDQILLYEYGDYETLTFTVYPYEDRGLVENLILNLEPNGEYSVSYIMYNFTEEEKQRIIDGGDVPIDDNTGYGVELTEFDTSSILYKSTGDNGIISIDGKCYRRGIRRVGSWSGIPGQLEVSEWEIFIYEVECPEEHTDPSFTEDGNGGAGSPPPAPFPNFNTPYPVPIPPAEYPGGVSAPPTDPNNPNPVINPIFTRPIFFLDQTLNRECDKINNHMNSGITDLRDKLVDLATKTGDPVERGFGISQLGGTFEFTTNTANGDIIFTSAAGIVYEVLSHTHNTGKLSVFSFDDLEGIAQYIRGGHINDENNQFIATLSTDKGTHFVLTISNMARFKDFFFYKTTIYSQLSGTDQIKYAKSVEKADKLKIKYYDSKIGRILPQNINNELVLKEFLSFLNETDMGISLFETDSNFQNFSKVRLKSNGTIERKPCD